MIKSAIQTCPAIRAIPRGVRKTAGAANGAFPYPLLGASSRRFRGTSMAGTASDLAAAGVSALAGDRDVFVATGMGAVLASLWNRAGNLIRVDAPVGRSLGEVPRLAIGQGSMGAAFLTLGEALVDAVAVRLVGDDENAAVGRCRRGGKDDYAGQKRGNGSRAAPGKKGVAVIR